MNTNERWRAILKVVDTHTMPRMETTERARFNALALCGEAGELANVLKKLWRGDTNHPPEHFTQQLREELADVRMYTQLLADELGIDLDHACEAKIRTIAARWNVPIDYIEQQS